MRFRYILYYSAVASIMTLGACRRDSLPEPSDELVEVSFTAAYGPQDAKALLSGLKMQWSPGDEIGVAAKVSDSPIYKFTTKDGGVNAVFTGSVPAGFTAGKAFFPYSSINANSSDLNFQASGIPASEQHCPKDGFDAQSIPLVTSFDELAGTITFHHLSSLLKVHIAGSDVSSVKLSTNGFYVDEDTKCHGALSIPQASWVNIGSESRVFNSNRRGAHFVVIKPVSGNAFEPGDYHIVIPATADKDERIIRNLTITYTKTDGSCWTRSSSNPLKILPGRIYDIPGNEGNCTRQSDNPVAATVGEILPGWVKGCFDIHFINTQSGEGAFLIFPDGTQMLIDCAGSLNATGPVNSTTNVGIRERWDPTQDPTYNFSTMFEEYIRQCQTWTANNKIDYMLDTHFHGDHFGGLSGRTKSDRSDTYVKQSMPYLLDVFQTGKVMDRGYPDYNYPFDMQKYHSTVRNWVTALKWHVDHTGVVAEKFKAGSNTQIVMKYAPGQYPSFSVRNIGVNGEVWTGSGTSTKFTFPTLSEIVCANPPDVSSAENCPAENHNSCVAKFTYGDFDYWAGGDQQYNGMSAFPWKDSESTMAKACGQVDVMKADHHGTTNTNGSGHKGTGGNKALAMQYLNPKCWIVNNWVDGQPRQATYEGVVKMCPDVDIFITNTCTSQTLYGGYAEHTKGANGHIVVRVYPGGKHYYVYVVADKERSMKVKSVSGPYTSR